MGGEPVPDTSPIVRALLDAGAEPDHIRWVGGKTALRIAAFSAAPQVVTTLLAAGADPKAVDDVGTTTAHMLAARIGYDRGDVRRMRCLEALLNGGADPQPRG